MRQLKLVIAGLFLISPFAAKADPIDLFRYSLNIDGTVSKVIDLYVPVDPVPAGVDVSGFNENIGIGEIEVTMTGAGAHSILAFFDHELNEPLNGFFDESGGTSGSAAPGQSWEIDEPGYVNGDIYANFLLATLDNGIGTTGSGNTSFPDDVSMAMGWNFTLAVAETATITFTVGESDPGGFFLWQSDPDTLNPTQIYLSSMLEIRGASVPEPGTLALLGLGLAGMGMTRRKKKA